MKRLSIIIPTYNMDELLPACLDSLVASAALNALDIVVVNDGSRDNSLAIANTYAAKYPSSVRVIDKPNGNYGSTINAALPTLTGEYVKILDADDTFDTAAIEPFVAYLEQVSGADMVVGPFVEIDSCGEHRVDYDIYSRRSFGYGMPYSAEQVFEQGTIDFFMMHSIAYRTALLQEIGYHQREGISYTDQLWCFHPIFKVQSIAFTDISLYRYNLTREGQTMNSAVQLRRIGELEAVVTEMAQALDNYGKSLSEARRNFLAGVVMRRMQTVLRKYLLEMSDGDFAASHFTQTLESFTALAPQPLTVVVNNRLKIDLLKSWTKSSKRKGKLQREVLLFADRAMQRAYRTIFKIIR